MKQMDVSHERYRGNKINENNSASLFRHLIIEIIAVGVANNSETLRRKKKSPIIFSCVYLRMSQGKYI